jgi:hypothetical protein
MTIKTISYFTVTKQACIAMQACFAFFPIYLGILSVAIFPSYVKIN